MNRYQTYKSEILEYKGYFGCKSQCKIEIYIFPDSRTLKSPQGETKIGTTIVMATEIESNEGTSITNLAEQIATEVCMKHGIDPLSLIWIEHYPAITEFRGIRDEDTYSIVTFELCQASYRDNALRHPNWRYIHKGEVERDILKGNFTQQMLALRAISPNLIKLRSQ